MSLTIIGIVLGIIGGMLGKFAIKSAEKKLANEKESVENNKNITNN